jgi:hypothetical protein
MAHRPYANGVLPSVTQVTGILSAPGLPWGAARETAMFAVHHTDQWMDLPVPDAVNRVYRHHRGVWDHRALLGTAVHTVNAEWCKGNTVRVLDVVQEMRETSQLWRQMPETQIYGDLLPMTDGLAQAWHALEPETLSFEQVVRYPDERLGYIGTFDWRANINGQTILLDLKTTGKRKPGQNKYWDTWRLQLAAYRYCKETVVYSPDGLEMGTMELPPVDGCAVVHIYGNGAFQVDGVEAGPREHEVFLGLRDAYGWRQRLANCAGQDVPLFVGSPT